MNSTSALQSIIDQSCRKLEDTAAMLQVSLSKVQESALQLEEIIVALREMRNEPALTGATFMAGAYLGEIIRAKVGGSWVQAPNGELSLHIGDKFYHPVAKVRKFSAEPSTGDGLLFFASAVIAAHAQQGAPGDGFAAPELGRWTS